MGFYCLREIQSARPFFFSQLASNSLPTTRGVEMKWGKALMNFCVVLWLWGGDSVERWVSYVTPLCMRSDKLEPFTAQWPCHKNKLQLLNNLVWTHFWVQGSDQRAKMINSGADNQKTLWVPSIIPKLINELTFRVTPRAANNSIAIKILYKHFQGDGTRRP